MAGNFQGIQFSQEAHLQRFRDLIFTDERSEIAPTTTSVRLCLLLQEELSCVKEAENYHDPFTVSLEGLK